jgi:hypothetical protein
LFQVYRRAYYIKVDVQPILSQLSHREFIIWKERRRGGGERDELGGLADSRI